MAGIAAEIARTSSGVRKPGSLESVAIMLSAVAILSSALHFWPWQGSRTWQLLGPVNSAILLWMVILTFHCFLGRKVSTVIDCLPRPSVLSFLCIGVLSIATAPDVLRAGTYVGKMLLMYLGAYTLFRCAGRTSRGQRVLQTAACVALGIAVLGCHVDRSGQGSTTYGFFGDAHKYGSYVATLCAMCAGILLMERRSWLAMAAGIVLVTAVALSIGALGGAIALGVGLAACLVIAKGAMRRLSITCAIVCAIIAVFSTLGSESRTALSDDMSLMEMDGRNCRQRYLEWQALINLFGERAETGTGGGCLNTFRSAHYYRLPKLNTMGAFEQNGWLAVAAETGVLGLVCFCWMIWDHAKSGLRRIALSGAPAGQGVLRGIGSFAALCAACAANVFSSIQYNGVLIIFVLVLALSAPSGRLQNAHGSP